MNKLWKALGNAQGKITKLEDTVLANLQPPIKQERVLPFFETGSMSFALGDNTPKTIVLVQSANRRTKITSLSYAVEFLVNSGGSDVVLPGDDTPYGVALLNNQLTLMDFVWNFELGSTERSYANGRVEGEESWLSRSSLGFVNNQSCLLFSEKSPLLLTTNEFFKISIKPTLFTFAGNSFTDVRCIIHFDASGWRTFSDS